MHHAARGLRACALLMSGALVTAVVGLPTPAIAAGSPHGEVFVSPGPIDWPVPAGVFEATFTLIGAGGGAGRGESAGDGGRGGVLKAVLPVNPGDVYHLHVGGRGGGYSSAVAGGGIGGVNGGGAGGVGSSDGDGGGGGGASDVRFAGDDLSSRILVAGGGGGDSGPSPVNLSSDAVGGGRGSGGTTTGSSGAPALGGPFGGGLGGGSAGGAGGLSVSPGTSSHDGQPGAFGTGGTGGNGILGGAGGGGGGGWYGGGGGGGSGDNSLAGGGGGGGSAYAIPTAVVIPSTVRPTASFDGEVIVEYLTQGSGVTPPTLAGSPPDGVLGTDYGSYAFPVTGSPAPTCTSDTVPPGLTLNADCTLSGTPTATGSYPFTVTADNGARAVHLAVSLDVVAGAGITGEPTTPATIGVSYSFPYVLTGDPAPTTTVSLGSLPLGLALSTDGKLTGTPTEAGSSTFTVTASNGASSDAVTSTIVVQPRSPSAISGTPPLLAYKNVPFSFTYTLGGAPLPTAFAPFGGLPPGLDISPAGRLSGSPSALGTYTFRIFADNTLDEVTGGKLDTVTVLLPAPDISGTPASTLPTGVGYSFSYTMTGSPTPKTSVDLADLPPGMTLDSDGQLGGIPTTPGRYTFTITAANGVAPDDTVTSTIDVVEGQPATISGSPPEVAMLGSTVDFTYVLGGVPVPTATVTDGDLPQGLALGTDGHLTGIPTKLGTFTFTVTADNPSDGVGTTTSTITVQDPSPTITGTAPSGAVREPYSFTFVTGGTPTPTVTRSAGTLPPGLSLSPAGTLSGTPTRAGTYAFTVQAANGVVPAGTQPVTLTVLPRPIITIAGSRVVEGNSGTRLLTFVVTLSRASTVKVPVHWSTANGTAVAGTDYGASQGSLMFSPGQTTQVITVAVVGDRTRERDEFMYLRLQHPANSLLIFGNWQVRGDIFNDD